MSFDWKILLFAWLILGIASSMLVYWDMDRRRKVNGTLALICIPLSIFGLLVYFAFRGRIVGTGRELPPKPDYGKPEYRFKEEPMPKEKAEQKGPEKAPEPEPVVEEATVVEQKEEEVLPVPPAAEEPKVWKEERAAPPAQIEGIPRCPKCRAAVSSFDSVCGECGAKLK